MGANAGTLILASQYNGWWSTLNTIKSKWNGASLSFTPITVGNGTIATANNMNSLINTVNGLKSFFSGADWTNFTESKNVVTTKLSNILPNQQNKPVR